MDSAAPVRPATTRALLCAAGALFVLNFHAFVASMHSAPAPAAAHFVPVSTPSDPCGEVQVVLTERVAGLHLQHATVPSVRTRIEICRRRTETTTVGPDQPTPSGTAYVASF